jgi:uncharacterized RDD family membrane protein YckC
MRLRPGQLADDFDDDLGPAPELDDVDNEEPHDFRYASFAIRVFAFIVDWIVLAIIARVVFGVMFFAIFSVGAGMTQMTRSLAVTLVGIAVNVFLGWMYYPFMEASSYQATLGKLIFGIIVTDLDGRRISHGTATLRWFAGAIASIPLGFGYLMVLTSPIKQGLHDKMAGTLVLYRSANRER